MEESFAQNGSGNLKIVKLPNAKVCLQRKMLLIQHKAWKVVSCGFKRRGEGEGGGGGGDIEAFAPLIFFLPPNLPLPLEFLAF